MNNSSHIESLSSELETLTVEFQTLLSAEKVDDEQLSEATLAFESFVDSLLKTSLDIGDKEELIKIALENNTELVRLAEIRRAETKLELSNLVRGQKAVKNYK